MRGILVLFLVLGVWGCSKTEPQGTLSPALKTSEIEERTKGAKLFEGTYEDRWEKFKNAMVTNDPNWDWVVNTNTGRFQRRLRPGSLEGYELRKPECG